MSLFDSLKRQLSQELNDQVKKTVTGAVNRAAQSQWTVSFSALPRTLAEMQALPEAALTQPHFTAALTVAALCLWPEDREEAKRMLTFLSGPRTLSPMDWQQINDRFMDGKGYIPRSYFAGATPQNDYAPTMPYTLTFRQDPYGCQEENYFGLLLRSGGADSERKVKLRKKPSTGQWFLWQQDLLVGIRVPVSQDAWA